MGRFLALLGIVAFVHDAAQGNDTPRSTTIKSNNVGSRRVPAVRAPTVTASAAFWNPIDVIVRDFRALTRRSTAYHILLPKSRDVALTLKQQIRNKVAEEEIFVVDAFAAAALRYSRDLETAKNGGLLGESAPQGFCRSPELDRACFTEPLGKVCGPIESEFGYHLLLVRERTNCEKLDGKYTRIIPGEKGETVYVGPEGGQTDPGLEAAQLTFGQLGFWAAVFVAGGVVAELAASIAEKF
mmetsp:Transcript_35413/g.69757  ORF Transcript_35413/g.69757 Transcript_35413/m.69757 type:complete len:241 (-) Transcript_35413:15-737(-)